MRTFWLVLLVVIIAAAVLIVRWQLHKRKVAAFTAFATARGWTYRQRDDRLTERYLGTPFGQGFGGRRWTCCPGRTGAGRSPRSSTSTRSTRAAGRTGGR